MSNIVMKDKAGYELAPGDFIVYGHALGRCAGLRYGVVIAVKESKSEWRDKKTVNARIRGVDDDWGGEKPKLLSKDSTLQFGDRIVRINENQMPKKVRDLLKTVEIPR